MATFQSLPGFREFYPDVPQRQPLRTSRDLIDLTAVQEATGWAPRERIRAEIIED